MTKSRHKTTKSKCTEIDVVSLDTLVDWRSLLSLIADELDAYTRKLQNGKQRLLKVRNDYFAGLPDERPSIKGLQNLASALGSLELEIGFDQHRANLFQYIARAAICDRQEEFDGEFLKLDSK